MAVVSAAYGITDELIKIVRTAQNGDLEQANKLLTAVCEKVKGIARDLEVTEVLIGAQ
jgi:aspartokinase